MSDLRISDFDFHLPPELIAQEPPQLRGQSRMLVLDKASQAMRDAQFAELPSLLAPGDLLVLNNSRVIPARLYARRTTIRDRQAPTALVEVLLTEPTAAHTWSALVRPGKKIAIGEKLIFPSSSGEAVLEAEVVARGERGERVLRFSPVADFYSALEQIGHMPLPPYIHRDDEPSDRERYQTIFARERGSVAAPTAGLHFTPQVLEALTQRGVEIAYVTLHVGLGTFAPLRVERVNQVHLHCERYELSTETATALNRARRDGRRIVAVGTTVVRTLEAVALAAGDDAIEPTAGTTDIFIAPGFEFRLVRALLTNFHLPQSSLLMLVCAFAGREHILSAYRHAVKQQYHFFSYGDCMFIA